MEKENRMEKIVSLCKRRGFVWQGSEIYGGVGAIYHFGPLGVEMKNAIKQLWWQKFVTGRPDVVGIESAVLMHPKVWEASGHLKSFTDPLVECRKCHQRYRADQLNEMQNTKIKNQNDNAKCKMGGEHEFTEEKDFNLMFKTFLGPVEDQASTTYLRPETAQGMFCDFKLVLESSRQKIPFGIAQIGKSFRNEITTGDFFYRIREFDIAEIEYFISPKDDKKYFEEWLKLWEQFYLDLGIQEKNLSEHEHSKESLAHYSKRTVDILYDFPFGKKELAGVANRTDYDLSQHQRYSGADMQYFDEASNEKYIPYVIEPTLGIERALLAVLLDAYSESDGSDGREKGEVVLKLDSKIAPIQVASFPLIKKDKLPEMAKKIRDDLANAGVRTYYDESGSIGRRYRRQDEIGTPWCITVDFDSLKDDTVTIRDRDTLKQERIKISEVKEYIEDKIG